MIIYNRLAYYKIYQFLLQMPNNKLFVQMLFVVFSFVLTLSLIVGWPVDNVALIGMIILSVSKLAEF